MSAAENKALLERLFSDISNGDSRSFVDALHPDFAWVVTGKSSWSGRYGGGIENVREIFLRPLHSRFARPNRTKAHRMTAEGNIVVVEAIGDSETPEGTAYQNEYCLIFVFRDGMIAEQIEYMDSAYCEHVLGKAPDVYAAYEKQRAA